MSPRKSVQQELTREMIMNAARDLFAQKGYQHVSMRQIAKELNYSHGAIYYHFKNKAELFYALVEEHFHMLNTELNHILQLELETEEKLRQIFIGYIRFGLSYQSHYEIMFLIKDEEIKDYLNQGPNLTYENFAQNVHALCGKNIALQDIWSVFLSLHGFVTHYCRHVAGFAEIESLANSHAKFLVKAIT
ncbi:TetR/AcrR family transcriptional regulator [Bacillus benzoevorans]|uniref:AcrR family transcriptional regulator n=1 Tax=Bacillus benzoevorans TaxID=1456 RepID=A0A7X0LWI9_9BACI|nr:TetR/AcrR family transcriptional regulator [Bacillus benzoevorans]MBB6445394.1 AcrR family transcriptional regulator [Bacillus benzoevorans]